MSPGTQVTVASFGSIPGSVSRSSMPGLSSSIEFMRDNASGQTQPRTSTGFRLPVFSRVTDGYIERLSLITSGLDPVALVEVIDVREHGARCALLRHCLALVSHRGMHNA